MDTTAMGNNGSNVSVIPIVGMGGMGKTTLAKLLYNDIRVDEYFQIKIWICVSEEFDKKTLMVNMIKSFTNQNLSHLDPDQLQTMIQGKLNGKKFLLVLDDVWNDERSKWVEFRDLLEGGAPGSKVIVTTRSSSVATIVGTAPTYNLKGLSHADCMSLLKKCAFKKEGEAERYPRLLEIGTHIVKRCGSLPLAVRTLGTLLYSKTDEYYWKFIRDNEIWKSGQKENDILPALRLSYDQMPPHLKPCFVICSLYTKGYQFSTTDLGHVWMAHGLLRSPNEREDMDDIASQYVKELHFRSFFQDFLQYGRLDHMFTMHDLVHDLALSLAQTEYSTINVLGKNMSDEIRHISMPDKSFLDSKIPKFLRRENNLQTLSFPPNAEGLELAYFLNTCISKCKYLRMLTLTECSFELLPGSIGDLKHLRYLDLSKNTRLRRLPGSICKLHNLLVLSVNHCLELEELPRKIRNLINLRVLEISIKQKHLREDGIGCLTSLRYFTITDSPNLGFLFDGIQNLTYLRSLTISDCKSLVSLLRNLRYLTSLEILMIQGCNKLILIEEDEDDDDQDIKVSLEILIFSDLPQLKTLPKWVHKYSKTLQNLLVCGCANFSSFPRWLQDFEELKSLGIYGCPAFGACDDELSQIEEDGIKVSLEALSLGRLKNLKTLPQWVRKYSKTLQKLRILGCEHFSTFPEWLQDFTELDFLVIGECPALSERCQKDNGGDWYKIAHITNMYIRDDIGELDLDLVNFAM